MTTLYAIAQDWSDEGRVSALKSIIEYNGDSPSDLVDTLTGDQVLDSLHGAAISAGLNPYAVIADTDPISGCPGHGNECGKCVKNVWIPCG